MRRTPDSSELLIGLVLTFLALTCPPIAFIILMIIIFS